MAGMYKGPVDAEGVSVSKSLHDDPEKCSRQALLLEIFHSFFSVWIVLTMVPETVQGRRKFEHAAKRYDVQQSCLLANIGDVIFDT